MNFNLIELDYGTFAAITKLIAVAGNSMLAAKEFCTALLIEPSEKLQIHMDGVFSLTVGECVSSIIIHGAITSEENTLPEATRT